MNIQRFFEHHGIAENPFLAEEARHDPVFARLMDEPPAHPDFAKVLGDLDNPSSAVVFGEKGSGKTAIRMLIDRKIQHHNEAHGDRRILLVSYDDLNPVLDRLLERRRQGMGFRRAGRAGADHLMRSIRLEDHQDAILARAVTRLVDHVVSPSDGDGVAQETRQRLMKLPRYQRVNLALLAALYDQSPGGAIAERWQRLRGALRFGGQWGRKAGWVLAVVLAIVAVGMFFVDYWPGGGPTGWTRWLIRWGSLLPAAGALWLVGAGVWGCIWRRTQARRISREMPAVERQVGDLRAMLGDLRRGDLVRAPLPHARPGQTANAPRYQLTEQFMELIRAVGYRGMLILVDRIDEPTVVSGDAERMKAVIWPMFDHKFLQQPDIGVKLLLPIELRHALHRESRAFFQEARLDKQHLIDRLGWSGATLYDLCTSRLAACTVGGDRGSDQDRSVSASQVGTPGAVSLTDLFDEDVTVELLIDALDQMQQPRDALKFLYNVIQEHCRNVPGDRAAFRIPRLTLEAVRRQQAQRVHDVQQGVSPA